MNLQQFKSLHKFQWAFIPSGLKSVALNWQIKIAQTKLLNIATRLGDSLNNNLEGELTTSDQIDDFEAAKDTLGLLLEMYIDGHHQKTNDLGLQSFISFIKSPNLRRIFFKIFEKSPILKSATISLICNPKELRDYNLEVFNKMDTSEIKLIIPHDRKFGFDRSVVMRLLKSTPELFATPSARIDNRGMNDNGGPIRALIDQLLTDIQRDLIVPYLKVPNESKEGELKERKMKSQSGLSKIEKNAGAGNAKFIWGIGRNAGLIMGLVFGKALQLDILLLFELDVAFYELLVNNSDETIEKYYMETYFQEIFKFKQGVLELFNSGNLEELLDILAKPESLRFTEPSTKAVLEEAKADMATKTNLWSCSGIIDCYDDIEELKDPEFPAKYIESVMEKVLVEFKEFIRELIRGLGMALPSVKDFANLPIPIIHPFAEFVPKLLNAETLDGKFIINKVEFTGDAQVPSLIRNSTIAASKVFSAFVLSLEERQLRHLVGIWTGSSTLSLKYSSIRVTFISPGEIKPYKVNFCNQENTNIQKEKDHVISFGEEYQNFFRNFSYNLLGDPGMEVSPDCSSGEGASIIPVRPSTCARDLMIYLQSTEQIFNSLVDLLYTPLTALRDNL